MNRNRFLLRRLHSLSGILFGGYIVVHLAVNATLLQGGGVYQTQVDKIHSLPFLMLVELVAIIGPIFYHAIYGTLIVLAGRPNVSNYGYTRNWAYFWQRVTSIILIFFIAFHVMSMKGLIGGSLGTALTFVPEDYATESTVRHLQAAWWVSWVVYPVGILAATFHLANGFWAAAVTWGLTVRAKSQKLWGYACVLLFLFTSACGFAALFAALAADTDSERYAATARAQQEGYDAEAGASELIDQKDDGEDVQGEPEPGDE